jgi:hypothetical protein
VQINRPGEDPLLLLTFYGPSDSLSSFSGVIERWVNDARFEKGEVVWLPPKYASRAHDADLMQVAFNGKGAAPQAWVALRTRAQGLFDVLDRSKVWGYTWLYHAFVPKHAVELSISELAGFALPSSQTTDGKPIACDMRNDSALCLLRIALGDASSPENTYMALTESDTDSAFWTTKSLFGRRTSFAAIDLLAHKVYRLIRQYRDEEWFRNYEQQISVMESRARALLASRSPDGAKRTVRSAVEQTRDMLVVLQELEMLQIAMQQQHENLLAHQRDSAYGPIAQFHLAQAHLAERELDLLVRKGRIVREHTGYAIESSNAELNSASAARQNVFQNAIAAIAAALAVPQLVDRSLAKELIVSLGISDKPDHVSDFAALAVQIGLIVLFGGLAMLVIRHMHEKNQG